MTNPSPRQWTVPLFRDHKRRQNQLAVLTAYDYPTAKLFDETGVDAVLVGDTLGMVIQGRRDTLSVTLDEMVYHTKMVRRGVRRALVVADMPFMTYHLGLGESVKNAGRLVKEAGADAVKLEGGIRSQKIIEAICDAEIPVMGHVGLTPQSIRKLGRYRVQRMNDQILADAHAVESAGAFAVVLESIPQALAAKVTDELSIPTIGIGAGPDCDGQVLVWTDALGLTTEFEPKFVKRYANLREQMVDAVRQYCDEVRSGKFPDDEHSYD